MAKGKTPQKTAKKKLIDGQYSHKFLTRLRPEVGDKLESLLKRLNEKTYNGAIVEMISSYMDALDKLAGTEKALRECRQQMNKQANLIMALKGNFKTLLEMPLMDLAINDEGEEEEEGEFYN